MYQPRIHKGLQDLAHISFFKNFPFLFKAQIFCHNTLLYIMWKICCVWDLNLVLVQVNENGKCSLSQRDPRVRPGLWTRGCKSHQHYSDNGMCTGGKNDRSKIRGHHVYIIISSSVIDLFLNSTKLKSFSRCSTVPASHRVRQNLDFRKLGRNFLIVP